MLEWGNAAEILQRVTRRAISGFSLSSDVFCMRLQKDISEETLNKWDKHLSSVHMLMPILMKYPMKENEGGWYHRMQRKTSGYTLSMMQRKPCLAFEKLLRCLPEKWARQHRPLFHPLAQIHLCHLVMSWERLSRVVFCLNIVQLHYFVLLFFFFSAGSVPHFPYAKPLLVLHGNDHSVSKSIFHSTMHNVVPLPQNHSIYSLARQRICVFGARGCESYLNWLNFTLNARQSVALV